MARPAPTNVMAAFEILLEEIEAEIELTNQAGARAFENGDYARASRTLDQARELTQYRDQVVELRKQWSRLVPETDGDGDDVEAKEQRRNLGRLPRGMRTPEEAFFLPILRVLAAHGGSARASDVLDSVGEMMADALRDIDYEPLLSDPRLPRWRNTAQWARNTLVRDGYLKDDSPRGVWELSEKGRHYLADNPD